MTLDGMKSSIGLCLDQNQCLTESLEEVLPFKSVVTLPQILMLKYVKNTNLDDETEIPLNLNMIEFLQIQKEGETVRAWLKHEFGIQTTYQGFLHSEIWGTYKGPAAIAWILKKNGLIENGKFQVLCYQKHKNGVFCRFECDDELAAAIDSHGHTLRAGICRVILKKKVITPTFAGSAEAEAETGEEQQRSSTV